MDNYSPDGMAENLYNLCCDMDKSDYDDTKDKIISDITDAIYNIKAIAQNQYNSDYWRTFYSCLQSIANVDN